MNLPMQIEPLDPYDPKALKPLAAAWDFWSLDSLSESYKHLLLETYIARYGSKVVGVSIWSIAGETADLLYVFTDGSMRGRGVGKQMLTYCHEQLRAQGMRFCVLEVRDDNTPALELYKKLKYIVDRKIPKYYKDGTSALMLVKELTHSGRNPC